MVMKINPIRNAFLAELYIISVVTIISNGERIFGGEDNVLIPMAMISLLVLSVLVMFSLFILTPIQLYLDNRKVEALNYLYKATSVFAVLTVAVFCVGFAVYSLNLAI